MKITDCHAHIFPSKIAEKASVGIGDFYDTKMRYLGDCEHLLESGSKAGISRYWVHSVATTPAQVRTINDFIAQQCEIHPEFVGFGTIHPGADVEAELDHLVELGLCGVKIHPDFQKFRIDDKEALAIYDYIAGKLPLIVHTGDYRYEFSQPQRMAKVLDMFPRLDCIGAHFGGWSVWDDAYEHLGSRRCWVDTSSTFGFIENPEHVKDLVDKWGTERMLFGSDFPMWDHSDELRHVTSLGLSDAQLEAVLDGNAEALLRSGSINYKAN